MSCNNCITDLLEIKEENIIFDEIFMENEIINGIRCHIFKGYLYNKLDACPKCGCINENNNIIKKGCKVSLIKMNKTSEITTYLKFKKQVYYCKECKKKTVATTNFLNKGCYISNNVKSSVFNYCKEPVSKKYIAKMHNVSDNTVQNIIDEKIPTPKLYKHSLPKVLCIDEFTYKKRVFAFNMCDGITGKIIDLVEDRSVHNLEQYFSYYSEECRKNVKYVVMDMYLPYIELIKKFFPNAKIIIDLFHIVQLITNSLNKTRINVMKNDKEDRNKYKRYWKLILKSRFDLNNGEWRKFRCFKNLMTESDVVDYLIDKDIVLEKTYKLYQDLLYYLRHRDYDNFKKIINAEHDDVSDQMKTTIKTLKKYSEYIKNTLEQPYSNGVMERNNNTCKLIKRVSYGFRNFKNMKQRAMIILKIFRQNKREYHTEYSIPKYA